MIRSVILISLAIAVCAVPDVPDDVVPENIKFISDPSDLTNPLAPKQPILEAPDAGVKRYHDDICDGDRSAALENMITTEGYASSESVTKMIDQIKTACDNDDHQKSIWNFQTIVEEVFGSFELLAQLAGVDVNSDSFTLPDFLKPFKSSYDEAQRELQDTAKMCKQYSKESLLQVEKPKGDHPLLVQAWDVHTKQQECAEKCLCTEYGTAQYCSGTPECSEAVKATTLVATGLSVGAHAYKDGGMHGSGVWGDKKFHDAIHEITDKVQGTVRDHRHQQSLVQTGVKGPALCARLAYVQFLAGYMCHINCNGYTDSQEISVGCDIPVVPNMLAINIELHITWGPVIKLTVNAVVPGISDVLGEIQKIPACNTLMSAIGMNNGGMALGVGILDFTKGYGSITHTPYGYSLIAVRAQAQLGMVLRFDTSAPSTTNPSIAHFCSIGWFGGPNSAICQGENVIYNCAVCGTTNIRWACNQCRTSPSKFVKVSGAVWADHIQPKWGWPPYEYNRFWSLQLFNIGTTV